MKIFVTAKTRAKETTVEQLDGQHFKVAVKEAPIKGKANEAVLQAVAEFLGVPASCISIKTGFTSKKKVLEIQASAC